MDEAGMIRGFMAGLIRRAGGIEAAAELIGAGIGREVGKGTVSKRQSGHLDWPLVEIMALEDAVGDPCVRRWLERSLPEAAVSGDLMRGVADASKEAGEAISAVMGVLTRQGALPEAQREVSEALVAFGELAARLKVAAEDGV